MNSCLCVIIYLSHSTVDQLWVKFQCGQRRLSEGGNKKCDESMRERRRKDHGHGETSDPVQRHTWWRKSEGSRASSQIYTAQKIWELVFGFKNWFLEIIKSLAKCLVSKSQLGTTIGEGRGLSVWRPFLWCSLSLLCTWRQKKGKKVPRK